jgi:hypothetical protein
MFALNRVIFGVLAISSLSIQAQVLIIDVSNPAAVTISGTSEFATATLSTGSQTFPIWLSGFFGVGQDMSTTLSASSTSLATYNAGHTLGSALVRFIPGDTTLVLRQGPPSNENFSLSNPAFTGSAPFDFSSLEAGLPFGGTTGNVLAYNGSATTVVGSY